MRLLSLALIAVSLLPDGIAAQEDVAEMARLIDRRIETKMAKLSLQPAPRADDAEFDRRVTLDITGRILSADRVRAFLEDADPDKRAKLIDELLASPSHGRYHAYLWRDSEHQFMATMLKALGIDPAKEYMVGARPVPIVDRGTEPVNELF